MRNLYQNNFTIWTKPSIASPQLAQCRDNWKRFPRIHVITPHPIRWCTARVSLACANRLTVTLANTDNHSGSTHIASGMKAASLPVKQTAHCHWQKGMPATPTPWHPTLMCSDDVMECDGGVKMRLGMSARQVAFRCHYHGKQSSHTAEKPLSLLSRILSLFKATVCFTSEIIVPQWQFLKSVKLPQLTGNSFVFGWLLFFAIYLSIHPSYWDMLACQVIGKVSHLSV